MNPSNGNVALVTGANSGLGFEAAAQLADAGFSTIILAARNEAKAEQARALLTERTARDVFETLAMDLGELESVDAAVAELATRGAKILDRRRNFKGRSVFCRDIVSLPAWRKYHALASHRRKGST
ncbi:MAG: SDR family NAD(P)-dependent oxidoreductase [Bacteroidetes bacterium]|nr:SDR family NAD(P)-dependent oxidoreductase [Bacteroidota bacterium]